MEFTERRYSVLLVSSSPKFNESMLALLPESRFYPVAAVSDVSSARRRLLESKYDIVIINAPLPDDFGTRLALNICDNSGTAVLLFVKAEHYPDINGRVSPFGVLVLPKPASSQTVSQSLQLLCGTRERLRRMEQKTASIEEKMEEIRIINRAKLLLMEQLKMTEKEAHRFIEKQAKEGHQTYVVCPAVETEEPEEEEGENGQFISLSYHPEEEHPKPLSLKAAVQFSEELQKAMPSLRVGFVHGKMKPKEKEEVMAAFARNEIQVLVSTTVIEVGVNVPNATLMVVENAERFGLSQLHQLRGRVGRSSRRAYAYFTYPGGKELKEISEKRLEAIRDFTEFGSGFRIAMRDMELRGVGNLLGAEQHGHMESIGYDLYMKLLGEAVLEEKGTAVQEKPECTVDMKVDAYIPESYISNENQRIDAYKKISLIQNAEDLSDVYDELSDRYGELPLPVMNLLTVSHLRALGAETGITKILLKGSSVLFYPQQFDAVKAAKLAAQFNGRVMITLSGIPYIALRAGGQKLSQTVKDCRSLLLKYKELGQNA